MGWKRLTSFNEVVSNPTEVKPGDLIVCCTDKLKTLTKGNEYEVIDNTKKYIKDWKNRTVTGFLEVKKNIGITVMCDNGRKKVYYSWNFSHRIEDL